MKTIEEINQRIKDGDAVVVTAAEMTQIVKENGLKKLQKILMWLLPVHSVQCVLQELF